MIEVSEQESRVEGPHADDKDLFLNALGALLASTMVSDLSEDFCENDR